MAPDGTAAYDRLAALHTHLLARGLTAKLTPQGLRISNPQVSGCCDKAAADLVTCRPRPEDGGALWFYTSWQEPIGPADDIIDASVFIIGYLNRRAER